MGDVLSYRDSDDSVTVSWSLPDLPTAFHKAGLAGLLCYVRTMPKFAPGAALPSIECATPLELRIRFTQATLQTLMDSVYAGETHLVESSRKWPNGTLKAERSTRPRRGHDRPTRTWVYEVIRPKADLMVHWRGGDTEDRWVALWREALRGVLRDSKKAEIYAKTTKGHSPTEESGDLKGLWRGFVSGAKRGRRVAPTIPKSMLIGAEGQNAERVAFKGEVRHNLLLHFWPFVTPVFVPRALRRTQGQWKIDTTNGYVLAVAEVGDLIEFSKLIDSYWRRRPPSDDERRRPRDCEIDVAVEGGMAFLRSLAEYRLASMDDGDFFDTVPQVDLYHLEKRGNNVRTHLTDSIRLTAGAMRRYERVAQSRRNTLFRRLLMRNTLDGRSWYACAAETLFTCYPVELFVHSGKSPPFARNFGLAVREQFKGESTTMNDSLNLAGKVFDIVGQFVANRAERRSGVTREQLQAENGTTNWASVDAQNYLGAREKVATDAFLAIRGRNAEEFVDYFVGSICAVPQFMGAQGVSPKEGFIEVSRALHESEERRTEMRNLTMLALSAHGWTRQSESRDAGARPNRGETE
ncbi:MAG: type I-MYXAN CRISPR-associated protein Cmx8 [Spirochaetaceae bacterium]|nr:type I-MYXAN CRISPR-associated protein Cmx8 [Spirochaetaceae bacterium]